VRLEGEDRIAFRARLLAAAQAIPGVEHAARVNGLPFGTSTIELHVAGIDSVQRLGRFNYQYTSPDYFAVMQTRIIKGRGLTEWDRQGATPVMVISASMGRVLWPGQDPIGQCVRIGSEASPCTTVVGVAEDAVQNSITDTERLMYYLSDLQGLYDPVANQIGLPFPGNRILVRVSGGNAPALAERVRAALQRLMPGPAYVTVSPLEDLVSAQRRSWQLGAMMFVAFGGLALIVAAVGLYGVIGYNVAQRMHELGVRIALGAQSRDIIKLVVGQGLTFAVAGVALGLAVAFVAARWIQPLLFEQSARDVVVYGGVGTLIVLVALVATAVPAVRATRADPNTALRSD
jgi:hypothetical protein